MEGSHDDERSSENLIFTGEELSLNGENFPIDFGFKMQPKKKIAGKFVGVYTEEPTVYWVFKVTSSTTKAVMGHWLDCVNPERRLFKLLSDKTTIAYENIIRKGKAHKDFHAFDLSDDGDGLQVPVLVHLALLKALEKLK